MISGRRLIANVSATLILKVLAVFVGILSIPAYIEYFSDSTALGIWFTLLSILSWLVFFDLGLGNGLKNRLTQLIEQERQSEAKRLVSKGYRFVALLGLVIVLVFFMLMQLFSDPLKVDSVVDPAIHAEVAYAIAALVVVFIFQFPLRLSISLMYGLQKSAMAALIPLVTNTLVLLFLLLVAPPASGRLTLLVNVYMVALLVPLLGAYLYMQHEMKGWVDDDGPLAVESISIAPSIRMGMQFFAIQLCLLLINGSNEFLILSLYSASEVVDYQVYFRIFSVFMVGISTLTLPLWSALAQAHANQNTKRAKEIARFLRASLGAAAVGLFLLQWLFPVILSIWLPAGSVHAEPMTVFLFSLYTLSFLTIMVGSSVCNGFDRLSTQVISLAFAVFIKFALVSMYHLFESSWSSILLINFIAFLPAAIVIGYDAETSIRKFCRSHRAS